MESSTHRSKVDRSVGRASVDLRPTVDRRSTDDRSLSVDSCTWADHRVGCMGSPSLQRMGVTRKYWGAADGTPAQPQVTLLMVHCNNGTNECMRLSDTHLTHGEIWLRSAATSQTPTYAPFLFHQPYPIFVFWFLESELDAAIFLDFVNSSYKVFLRLFCKCMRYDVNFTTKATIGQNKRQYLPTSFSASIGTTFVRHKNLRPLMPFLLLVIDPSTSTSAPSSPPVLLQSTPSVSSDVVSTMSASNSGFLLAVASSSGKIASFELILNDITIGFAT